MRFVKYLACATVVAQASVVEEDDDLQFMRILSSNGTNTTTTGQSTTSQSTTSQSTTSTTNENTTTTSTGDSTSGQTTTGATSGNTTGETTGKTTTGDSKTNTTGESTGKSGDSGKTTGDTGKTAGETGKTTGEDAGKGPKVDKADKEMMDSMMANVSNGTNTSKAVVITVATTTAAADPLACGLMDPAPTTGVCAASSSSNSTNSTLRMLASHTADLKKAHNTFCGAFSFAGAYATCSGLGDSVVKLFTPSVTAAAPTAAQKNAALDYCVTGLTLASKIGTKDCYQSTATLDEGACFGNGMAVQRAATPSTAFTVPAVKACTTSSGSDPAAMSFKTSTDMSVPEWRTTGANAVTVDTAAVTSAAKTKAADNVGVLQNALVMAAVEINTKMPTVVKNSNLASSLGMSDADLKTITDAVVAAGGVGGIKLTEVATPDSTSTLGAAIKTASTKVAAAYTPTVTVDGAGGGATSGATSMMVGGATVIGLLSLVF